MPDAISAWFGQSCVTADGTPGSPLMVFRGTVEGEDDIGGTDPVSGKELDLFWATSSRKNACFFADDEIQNLYLKLEKPLILNEHTLDGKSFSTLAHEAWDKVQREEASWDGVIFEDVVDGSHPSCVYVVFPVAGTVAEKIQVIGRTRYDTDGNPVFIGLQPCGKPESYDRGDTIRHSNLDYRP